MHNQLSGSLPGSIVNLTLLKDLTINHNNLSGTIPVNIGNLTNLEKLRLHNNQLEGPIPQSIGALTALDELELNNNQLTGTIPETIAAFTNLTMLSLNDNLLSGILPSEVTDLPNLFWLNLKNNQLRGPLSISLCSSSPVIQIENNHFNFDALEPISGCLQDIFITYDPQALLPLTNNNPMLSVTAGGTLSQNTYTWYKDGTPVAVNAQDSNFVIPAAGTYFVEITNATVPDFKLVSEAVTITILGTLPFDFMHTSVTHCPGVPALNGKPLSNKTLRILKLKQVPMVIISLHFATILKPATKKDANITSSQIQTHQQA